MDSETMLYMTDLFVEYRKKYPKDTQSDQAIRKYLDSEKADELARDYMKFITICALYLEVMGHSKNAEDYVAAEKPKQIDVYVERMAEEIEEGEKR